MPPTGKDKDILSPVIHHGKQNETTTRAGFTPPSYACMRGAAHHADSDSWFLPGLLPPSLLIVCSCTMESYLYSALNSIYTRSCHDPSSLRYGKPLLRPPSASLVALPVSDWQNIEGCSVLFEVALGVVLPRSYLFGRIGYYIQESFTKNYQNAPVPAVQK